MFQPITLKSKPLFKIFQIIGNNLKINYTTSLCRSNSFYNPCELLSIGKNPFIGQRFHMTINTCQPIIFRHVKKNLLNFRLDIKEKYFLYNNNLYNDYKYLK